MAKNALGPVKLDAEARTSASDPDVVADLESYNVFAIQIDGNGTAAGSVLIQASLRDEADDLFVTFATVPTGANETDIVHMVATPMRTMRIDYSGLSAGAVDVKVTPMTEG